MKRKILKILLKVGLYFLALLFTALLLLQLPPIQNVIKNKILAQVNNQLNIPLSIDKIRLSFFDYLTVKNVFLGETKNDTLVYIKDLSVDIHLMDLLKKKVHIEQIKIKGLNTHLIKASADGILNISKAIKQSGTDEIKDSSDISEPFQFAIDRVVLTNIKFDYINEIDSVSLNTYLQLFDLKINDLNLTGQIYNINSLKVDGLWFNQTSNKKVLSENAVVEDTIQTSINIKLSFENAIDVNNLNVTIDDYYSNQHLNVNNTSLYLNPELIDIQHQNIKLKQFNISNARVHITEGRNNDSDQVNNKAFSFADLGWNIELNKFIVDKSSFIFNRYESIGNSTSDAVDLNNLHLQLSDIVLDSLHFAAKIDNLKLLYNKHLLLQHLSTSVFINKEKAIVDQFKIETEKSLTTMEGSLYYGSFQLLQDHIEDTKVQISLNTQLNSADVFKIIQQANPLKQNAEIKLKANVVGNLSRMRINQFCGEITSAFSFDLSGLVNNISDIESVGGKLKFNHIRLQSNEILSFLPDSLIPTSISLPDSILITGNTEGSGKLITSNIKLKSPKGNIDAQFHLDLDSMPEKEFFTTELFLQELDLGYLLQKEDTLQKVSLKGVVKGSTNQFQNPNIHMDFVVKQIGLLNYCYKKLLINGSYSNRYFKGNVKIDDENIGFVFDGEMNFKDSIPFVNANLNMNRANLKALNLLSDSTSINGKINVAVEGREWNHLNGSVLAQDIHYQTVDQNISLDSIKVGFQQKIDSSIYHLRLHHIYMQDTLLYNGVRVNAKVIGNKALFDYGLESASNNQNEKEDTLLHGFGEFNLQEDTMMIQTHLKWYQGLLTDPLSLHLKASQIKNQESTIYQLQAEGNQLKINAEGNLKNTKTNNYIDASVKIDSLDFSLIESLTHQFLNKFQGHLIGNINVSGEMNSPDINGFIAIKNTTINPVAVNTDFIIDDGRINVNKNKLSMDHLKIYDRDGNEAFMDGVANFTDFTNPEFNLKFEADQFLMLNKTESADGNYYGKVIADLNVLMKGNMQQPNIILTTDFNRESNFTYVVTSTSPKASDQDDVVRFITDSTDNNTIDTVYQDFTSANIKGLNITTNIGITDKMDVTLVTDPSSNEKLNIVGNGDLSLNIDPSGNQTLTGQYSIKKGAYTLRLYDVIKRDFTIKEGGYLTWFGDVMNANADISAIYKVKTNALSLMGATQNELNSSEYEVYNTTINVEVVMNLSGDLLSPDIDFDITLSDKNVNSNIESVITQLNNDESELNKQVFSLLILNRFSSNKASASTTVSYELENNARQSLSKLLSQQLNRFSSQYLKGVDVSFDIDSYNQMVQNKVNARTDVSVDVSQNLFNDRLKLTVGGNVAVEENKQTGSASSSDLTGDFELEYKISKDGTYRLKAFNTTEYEDELNGDVTKTGLSLLFIKDFMRFRDLFKTHKRNNKDEAEQK